MIICSFTLMILILQYTAQSFDENVNINIDTSYLRWNNTFPAVSVCFTKGRSINPIGKFLEAYWAATNMPKPAKSGNYYRLAQSYLFVTPNSNIDVRGNICDNTNETCNLNLDVMQNLFFPQSCSEIFMDVKFLGKPYECDEVFKIFRTEMGPCFISNSIFSHNMNYEKLPLKYSIQSEKRTFEFRYKEIEALYIHSPEELPYLLMPNFRLRKSGALMHYALNTIEVFNKPDIKTEPIEQRECRFPYENITANLQYSFTNCFMHKRIQIELAKCNCTIPTSPSEYKSQYCNFKGLNCTANANILAQTKKMLFDGEQSCIQSCLEMEINLIGENTFKMEDESDLGHVQLEIMNLPTSRYERSVSRTSLDFIVSLGGVGGLFFGVSLLSIAEIFYFWLRR